ncbi:MAG: aspartate ammonia-lyase [Lachnospiraceae bacterium]|nr:aspartate ammonia-lyase [Lachnospiraceae bacterium]
MNTENGIGQETGWRMEQDKLGSKMLPEDVLYGINTARAAENFTLDDRGVNPELLTAMIKIKKAAAMSHRDLKEMDKKKADAIVMACDSLLASQDYSAFITNHLQGGAGTSTNMNVNEVIANLALVLTGHKPGEYEIISPLDDVNRSQSTNDVYPSALRIAAIGLVRRLADELSALQEELQRKENTYDQVLKLGRTELMDALPITAGQEFGAYAQAIARDRWRIYKVEERLRQLNLGGTAVGTGSNSRKKYTFRVMEYLRDLTGFGLAIAEYPMDLTQNNDVFTEVSGLLKAVAVNLMKISNDLRLMNMGPGGGLAEITLAPVQQGSTIMPGKINPVIPEMVTQAAIQVMANDTAITFSAASGQLELNAFLPLIADRLLESLQLLINGIRIFREKAIRTLVVNPQNCRKHLEHSPVLVTALVPVIGYDKAAALARDSGGDMEQLKKLVLEQGILTEEQLFQLLDYRNLTSYSK